MCLKLKKTVGLDNMHISYTSARLVRKLCAWAKLKAKCCSAVLIKAVRLCLLMSKSLTVHAYQMLPTGYCCVELGSEIISLQQSNSFFAAVRLTTNATSSTVRTDSKSSRQHLKEMHLLEWYGSHRRSYSSNKLDNSCMIRPVLCLSRASSQDKPCHSNRQCRLSMQTAENADNADGPRLP